MPCAANGAGLDWALALRGWCGVCTDTPVVPPSGQAASQPGPPAPPAVTLCEWPLIFL